MSKHIIKYDISRQYTKELNQKCGRKGYYNFDREYETDISPAEFGAFIQGKKKKKKY